MCNKNCYTCAFRSSIPGDAHSRCSHPLTNKAHSIPGALESALTGRIDLSTLFGMKINPHGFRNGWCLFPINFDPIWLEGECKAHMTPEEHRKLLEESPKAAAFEQKCLSETVNK